MKIRWWKFWNNYKTLLTLIKENENNIDQLYKNAIRIQELNDKVLILKREHRELLDSQGIDPQFIVNLKKENEELRIENGRLLYNNSFLGEKLSRNLDEISALRGN